MSASHVYQMGPDQNVQNDTAFSKIRLTTWLVQSTWWVSLILENAVSFGKINKDNLNIDCK